MKTIYCISGLAADERAFAKLDIPGWEVKYLSWLIPSRGETIDAYARRMSAGITTARPVLLGLSFGGMMSIEIAKFLPVEKIILISSIKTAQQLPWWMKLAGNLRVNHVFPMRSYRITEPVQNWFIGVTNEAERKMVNEYRANAAQAYIDWSINEILKWRNDSLPAKTFHIHGTADRIFPISNVTPTHIIKDGGHLMIMNKAAEINTAIQAILAS